MKVHPLLRVLAVLLLAILACSGGSDSLPPTSTPGPEAEPSPTPEGGGLNPQGFFDIELNPSDADGLTERANELYQELVNSGGDVDRAVILDAYQALLELERVGGPWRFVGPAPVEGEHQPPGETFSSGRTNSFAVDPRNSDVVYAAVSVGGIWKTEDGGQTWRSLTDNQVPLNYGSIVMNPNDPDTLYALLGEFDGQIAGDYGYLANGIMRTRDAGQTWELLGADVFNAAAVTALVFASDGTLFASSGQLAVYEAPPDQPDFGIFKSTDDGDTWEPVLTCSEIAICVPQDWNPDLTITAKLGGFMDLDITSDDALFASVCNIECQGTTLLRSTDGGESWDELGLSDAIQTWADENEVSVQYLDQDQTIPYLDGLEIATTPADPNVIIAGGGLWWIGADEDGREVEGTWSWVIRSTDGGETWEWLPEAGDYCSGNNSTPQCTYDNVVEIDPTDASLMYIGGSFSLEEDTGNWIEMVKRSADGGDTWSDMTPAQEGSLMHPDVHGLAFDPNDSNVLWVGNDGGIYRTSDASAEPPTWDFMGHGVGSLLFVDIGLHPTDPDYIIGGLQDNSCAFTADGGQSWPSTTCGGDGAYTAVDPFDGSIVYGSTYPIWVFQRNEQGGEGEDYDSEPWQTKTDGLDLDNEYWPFRPAFTVDPNNEGVVYIYANSVYKTEDRGDSWESISDYLSTDGYIKTLAVSASDSGVLYAGTTEGTAWVTTDGGGEWNEVTASDFPKRNVNRITIDPDDPNTAYAVFGGFDVQTPDTPGHVFRTTDGGESWEDITLNLPDAPLSSVVTDKRDQYAGVYVGGALGVWVLQDGSEKWLPYGTDMPFTLVTDLELNTETGIMAAGTWGRSVWVIEMP